MGESWQFTIDSEQWRWRSLAISLIFAGWGRGAYRDVISLGVACGKAEGNGAHLERTARRIAGPPPYVIRSGGRDRLFGTAVVAAAISRHVTSRPDVAQRAGFRGERYAPLWSEDRADAMNGVPVATASEHVSQETDLAFPVGATLSTLNKGLKQSTQNQGKTEASSEK